MGFIPVDDEQYGEDECFECGAKRRYHTGSYGSIEGKCYGFITAPTDLGRSILSVDLPTEGRE